MQEYGTYVQLMSYVIVQHTLCKVISENGYLQGDPNQDLLFQLALPLNVGIPDPKLVKPKCVWEVEVFCVKT